jgi:membrane protease YdiL (CAAX protease family)
VQDADPIAAPVGEQADETVRWGLGDALVGWFIAQVGAFITASIVLSVTGDEFDDLSIGAVALAQTGLWAGLFGVPWFAARFKGNGMVRDFGLQFRPTDALYAFVGVVCQYALILVYLPIFWLTDVDTDDLSRPAREMTDRADGGWGVVLLVLVVGIGAPIFEEIFYRGLVQRAFLRRFRPWAAVTLTALIFGLVHFQPLQFPSLALFGAVAGVLALRTGRLGPSIFAHMGFNLITVVALVNST